MTNTQQNTTRPSFRRWVVIGTAIVVAYALVMFIPVLTVLGDSGNNPTQSDVAFITSWIFGGVYAFLGGGLVVCITAIVLQHRNSRAAKSTLA